MFTRDTLLRLAAGMIMGFILGTVLWESSRTDVGVDKALKTPLQGNISVSLPYCCNSITKECTGNVATCGDADAPACAGSCVKKNEQCRAGEGDDADTCSCVECSLLSDFCNEDKDCCNFTTDADNTVSCFENKCIFRSKPV